MASVTTNEKQSELRVEEIAVTRTKNKMMLQCNIGSGVDSLLWFEVPSELDVDETIASYAFTLAAVAYGMQVNADVYIGYEMDFTFIQNLREYINIWAAWRPKDFSNIKVTAETLNHAESRPRRNAGLMCFSGGVDGCATLRENLDNGFFRAQYPIQAGLLIHGFDIPLSSTDRFDWLTESCTNMLASVRLPLYTVQTNWRDLILNWRYTHGLALASCLWLFSKKYDCGVIASGDESYNNLIHGSNPFSDRLISGDVFEIVSHGGHFSRIEKVGLISGWQEVLLNLNVCWANRKGFGNCGKCEKCVRTKLYFKLLGQDIPESLPTYNLEDEISSIGDLDDLRLRIWRSIKRVAVEKNMDNTPWGRAIITSVSNAERRLFTAKLKAPLRRLFRG
ncbi:MAG: hypothetical protein LAT65_15780 [Saccharospirillum sp.]|nr:hypothetical protein [Saccharospirillum sp.]